MAMISYSAEQIVAFEAFMERHAIASWEEPGCRVFDIYQEAGFSAPFVLYEFYADETTYQGHRATTYYERFSREAATMLETVGDSLFVSRRVLARR